MSVDLLVKDGEVRANLQEIQRIVVLGEFSQCINRPSGRFLILHPVLPLLDLSFHRPKENSGTKINDSRTAPTRRFSAPENLLFIPGNRLFIPKHKQLARDSLAFASHD
jgi:hypothetical protein